MGIQSNSNTLVEGEDDSLIDVEDTLVEREDVLVETEDENDGSFNTILQATQETVQNIGELTQEQIDISRNVATELQQHIVGSITDFVDKRLSKTGAAVNLISSASSAFAEEIISLFDIDTLPEVNDSEVIDNDIPSGDLSDEISDEILDDLSDGALVNVVDSLVEREDVLIATEDENDGSFGTIVRGTKEAAQNIGELTQDKVGISKKVATTKIIKHKKH